MTPTNLSSDQLDSLHRKFYWNISDEAISCNLTFNLIIMRSEPSGLSLNISMVRSGHIVKLDPSIYAFMVASVSGTQQILSNYEVFSVMNSKPWYPKKIITDQYYA